VSPTATPSKKGPLERGLTVLRTLAEEPRGLSLVDLSRRSGIPTSSLYRILSSLREAELVGETESGHYRVGVGALVLSRGFLDGLSLREVALPILRELVDETQETSHLGVLASPHIVYLEKVDSPLPIRMVSQVGGSTPALTTAIGRSILAHEHEAVAAQVIEASRRLFGIEVDAAALAAILATAREAGFSTDLQENEIGICCVAAPIFDHHGRVVAAVSVSAPATRFPATQVDERGGLVRAAAARISSSLGWTG
jgi:DNA-binding IclR family transcriptional regulator